MPEEAINKPERNLRKERIGEVMSNKMDKTIVVQVERRFAHPRFRKTVKEYKRYYVHDAKNEARVGDQVKIQEIRPLSKTKRWRLKEVVRANVEAAQAAS